jgi:ABC-type transport system involved in cytochrome c biogenesis permease subunit
MMPVAVFQAGIANISVGMRAKVNYLSWVRLAARFESVGKVRAE